MNLSKILGTAGSFFLVIGAMLKIMHMPGANLCFPLGLLFLIIFLIAWLLDALKNSVGFLERLFYFLLFATLFVEFVGTLFKIMHYPGAGAPFVQITMGLIILLIPTYLIYAYSEKDQLKKSTISTLMIAYMTLSGFVLILSRNIPNHILNGFAMPEQAIVNMTKSINDNNTLLYERAASDSLASEKAEQLKEMSQALVQQISNIKMLLIKTAEPELNNPTEDSINIQTLGSRANYDIPSELLLGGEDGAEPKTDENSAVGLKNSIIKYRASLLNMFDEKVKESLIKYIGLKTDNCSLPFEDEKNPSWESCNFSHKPMASVLIVLDQLKNEVRYAESLAIQQMLLH